MKAGLIDALNGRFLDGRELSEIEEDQHRVISIIDNLNRLFNARRGSVPHLPDYGLPDITEVYRELPYSIEGLRKAIKETVVRYEPRLRRVRIEHQQTDPYSMRLVFILSAEVRKRQRVRFRTTFSSNELATVIEGERPE